MRRNPLFVPLMLAVVSVAVSAGAILPVAPKGKGPSAVQAMAPITKTPTKVALAGGVSGSTTLTTAYIGTCLRISCTVDCAYRAGSGAQTATVDDNQLPAGVVERVCMHDAYDTIAFFSSAAGSAYVAVQAP